jgi:hypothetical protein
LSKNQFFLATLAAVFLLALAAFIIVPASVPHEPEYKGRKLSDWVAASNLHTSGGRDMAAEAIRQLGTNAVPYLLRWMKYEPPALRERYKGILLKIPIQAIPRKLWERDRLVYVAGWGFSIVGRDGSAALPELGRLLNDPHWRGDRPAVVAALTCMGEQGFLALARMAIGGPERKLAENGIRDMWNSGVNIRSIMPALAGS